MALKKSSKQLVSEASEKIETLSLEETKALVGNSDVQFVDIRDVRELNKEGTIPGAIHAPRGMLEFWVDPDSPYFKPVFAEDKKFILFCRSSWRSALAAATLKEMGLNNVAHISGGYGAWVESGGETVPVKKKI
ncbi:rhodanese-like domain-containing protein [Alcanivorax sp.]|jgi:rhodanese-related sulfurtransferase|uniref:rhodanese-like domain-containing protein n=1 Tax=Alcanivorax sp. TaxID=1872427 RepID=UPI0025B7B3F2|nr:rhodanese-like domain-containing protein [Alcanivorax sp.]